MDGHCQTGSVYILYVPSKRWVWRPEDVGGPFINDVNISGNVDDSCLYKSGDMGEGGVKSQ